MAETAWTIDNLKPVLFAAIRNAMSEADVPLDLKHLAILRDAINEVDMWYYDIQQELEDATP